MGVYRVEASPNNRAGCQTKPCKEAGVKITKGEFRYAVQVTIKEHQSWQYRHWGCVTPKQIENLIETCGGDTDLIDGYDELPAEFQEKVKYALENGHVHDDDWKGDVELNRPGKLGLKKRTPKKKAAENDTEDEDSPSEKPKKKAAKKDAEEGSAEEKPKKKGARKAKTDEDEAEAPAPKKKRGRAPKKEVEEEDGEEAAAPPPKKARGRAKKVEYKEASDEEAEAPPPKKSRGRKAAVKAKEEVEEHSDAEEEVEEAPKPKRGKKAATATAAGEKKVPQKRGRKKKAATDDE